MAIPQKNNASTGADDEIVFSIDEQTAKNEISIPDDEYMVKILKVTKKKSNNEGTQMAVFECQIEGDDQFKGLRLWHNVMLEGKGFPKFFFLTCRAAGINVQPGTQQNKVKLADFEGLYMGVKVVNQEYPVNSGNKKPRVVKVFSLNEQEEAPAVNPANI